jgi:uncharacterized paraquat-inducible protein A
METSNEPNQAYGEAVKARCPKCGQVFYPKLPEVPKADKVQCPHCRKKFSRNELEVLE